MTTLTLEDVNLADSSNFVASVPHEMFALLRREAPVWFHPSTDDYEGFWCIVKYADLVEIYNELEYATQVHRRLGCPVLEVSELSIEEISHRIIQLVERRKAESG